MKYDCRFLHWQRNHVALILSRQSVFGWNRFQWVSWIRSIKQKPGSKLFCAISDVTLPVGRGHSRSDPPCSRFLACAIALGSKPLALTRITRTGLESRLLKFEWEVRKPVYKIMTENLETKTFFNPWMTLHFFRYLSRSVRNTDVCWIT